MVKNEVVQGSAAQRTAQQQQGRQVRVGAHATPSEMRVARSVASI